MCENANIRATMRRSLSPERKCLDKARIILSLFFLPDRISGVDSPDKRNASADIFVDLMLIWWFFWIWFLSVVVCMDDVRALLLVLIFDFFLFVGWLNDFFFNFFGFLWFLCLSRCYVKFSNLWKKSETKRKIPRLDRLKKKWARPRLFS